jgi:hypothetical protein
VVVAENQANPDLASVNATDASQCVPCGVGVWARFLYRTVHADATGRHLTAVIHECGCSGPQRTGGGANLRRLPTQARAELARPCGWNR